ncbi:hypothetical protein [Streptomyces sp. Tue6028]|uniref:hypothetical protein n=1 Tax=Streptomyces sp. Tue6028 TaxID=2036037 RepID=UPI00211BD8E8|nr:hypothetical protein [Streptomyces sp. Tue6028]
MRAKTAFRSVMTVAALALLGTTVPGQALAATDTPPHRASAVDADDLTFARQASKETRSVVAANPSVAARAGTVCGADYTKVITAERLPSDSARYATVYVYTDGTTTGDRIYDVPTCGVLFNETGSAQSMGIRLKDNYTATPDDEDFGTFSTYAGPVRQKKGYCGKVYSYMKTGGRVVIDNYSGVGSCN